MKMMMFLAAIGFFSSSYAVHYDHYEINQLRLNTELYDLATEYQRAYFTAQDPALVVDDIINADLIPLHKEAILHQLLSAVAAQPPQAAHQYLVDVMTPGGFAQSDGGGISIMAVQRVRLMHAAVRRMIRHLFCWK